VADHAAEGSCSPSAAGRGLNFERGGFDHEGGGYEVKDPDSRREACQPQMSST
jgi:hypothetical protein